MKLHKLALKLLVITLACFTVSWIAAAASGINETHAYPKSLAKAYGSASPGSVEAKKSFSGLGLKAILIETGSTDVRVRHGESDTVELSLQGRLQTEHDPLLVNTEGGLAEVKVLETGPMSGFHIQWDDTEGGLVVTVPASVQSVVVKTISGDVSVKEMKLAELSVKTVSGDAQADNAQIGKLLYQSTSGDLECRNLTLEEFNGKTVSGDMDLRILNASPRIEAASTSGDLELRFQEKPSLKARFSTVSGEADIAAGLSSVTGLEGSAEFQVGDGKGSLAVKTVSGDLTIR